MGRGTCGSIDLKELEQKEQEKDPKACPKVEGKVKEVVKITIMDIVHQHKELDGD